MKTVYDEMTPKQIATMLNKTVNAVNKAINKMAKNNPEWKKKENGKVFITPDGVDWLVNVHFKVQEVNSLSVVDETELLLLKAELEKYKALYEMQSNAMEQMKMVYESQYQLALENQKQQLLLEHKEEYKHVVGNFYIKRKK